MLDIFALVVLLVIAAVAIWLVVLVAGIPGKMARASEHPHADANHTHAPGYVKCIGSGVEPDKGDQPQGRNSHTARGESQCADTVRKGTR